MIKKQLLTLIALCSLCFVGCDSTHTNLVEDDNISLEVTLERNMSSPYPLNIIYKLTNLSDKTVYYEALATPLSGDYSLNNFMVQEDGVTLKYKGIFAYLAAIKFNSLAPGETYSTFVSLDKIYLVTKGTHNYIISSRDEMRAKTSDNKTEQLINTSPPVEPDALPPEDHTSKIVPVKSNTLEFEATINEIRELE